jgi:hypothetical protein
LMLKHQVRGVENPTTQILAEIQKLAVGPTGYRFNSQKNNSL